MHSLGAVKASLCTFFTRVYKVQAGQPKKTSLKLETVITIIVRGHRWSVFSIHLPTNCIKGPSGEINARRGVLDSRRVLYCRAYCSLRSVSSVIKCYFSFSFTGAKTMNDQEKGNMSPVRINHMTPVIAKTSKYTAAYALFLIVVIYSSQITE